MTAFRPITIKLIATCALLALTSGCSSLQGTPAKAVENLMGTPTDRLSALLEYPATMAQKAQHLRAAGRLQR